MVEQRTENPCDNSSNLFLNIKIQMKNLWNFFSKMKNAQLSKKTIAINKRNKFCEKFLMLLWRKKFILGYKVVKFNKIKIFLKYKKNKPVINKLFFLSKPGNKIYYSIKQIWKLKANDSVFLFSTSKGLKSLFECKKQNIGGELVLIIK